MKLSNILFALAVAFPATLPASATPQSFDQPKYEILGHKCEAGNQNACRQLALETDGNCAGPKGSGCDYDSSVYLSVDNGLMVEVPFFGLSRVETVSFCLQDAGVERYQDLITDEHYDIFEGCLIENT
jgi:uncharacterized membrane protein